jgi:phosphonate transport system substrate-binding protein
MSGTSRVVRTLLLAALLAVLISPGGRPSDSHAATGEYVLGVFPHLPPRDIEEVYAPIARDLGDRLGKPVVLSSSTTFDRFSENLDRQMFDIVLVQPFDYVRIADRFGYRPLATRDEKLATVLVVSQDSPLKSFSDLRGKHLALPDDTAAVSLLAIAHLRKLKLVPGKDVTVTFHRSHISCMQQVVIGEADGCGSAAPSVRFFERKMNVRLKTIDHTREIPHALFAIHPRVPAGDREKIRSRILGWSGTEEGRTILSRGELKPFVAIRDADYNVVRDFRK